MRTMSDEDARAFVAYGVRTGKLATTGADGALDEEIDDCLVRLTPERILARADVALMP